MYQVLLKNPLTPSEISSLTRILVGNVYRVIKDFKQYKLVDDLTPNYSGGQLIKLSPRALEFEKEFYNHMELRKGLD